MKNSLLLYLFIVLALTNLFTYVYFSKEVESERAKYQKLEQKSENEINKILIKNADAEYFSLETSQNAQDYFTNDEVTKNVPYDKIMLMVKDQLLDLNNNANGNPYVGFDKMNDKKFIINKVQFLNHRWIIADFNNGDIWGEVLLKYFINKDQSVSFEIIQSLIYPK
ncbi:MAG: hypothetical protein ACI7YS_03270 [Flavobacterium sp.]